MIKSILTRELDMLETVHYTVDSGGKVGHSTRFVFLSDLHEKKYGEDSELLISRIDEEKPDYVLVGGDMIIDYGRDKATGRNICGKDVTLWLMQNLADRYRIFYTNGNHEQRIDKQSHEEFVSLIRSFGVEYLENETAYIEDSNIAVSGIDFTRGMYNKGRVENMQASYIEGILGEADRSRFNILLAHSPLFTDAYREYGVDLALCGHFHGGTIRITKKVGLMTPQYQLFNTKVAGEIRKNGFSEIISSGLGTHTINIRINNKPELVIVDVV